MSLQLKNTDWRSPHESAAEAIAATYDHARTTQTLNRLATDILCVAQSRDVLVYSR